MVLFKPVGANFIFLPIQVGSETKNTIVYNPQQRIFLPDKFPPALSSGALTGAVFNQILLGKNRARLHEILVKNTEKLPILVGQSKHRPLHKSSVVSWLLCAYVIVVPSNCCALNRGLGWCWTELSDSARNKWWRKGIEASRYNVPSISRVFHISKYLDWWEKLRTCNINKTILHAFTLMTSPYEKKIHCSYCIN